MVSSVFKVFFVFLLLFSFPQPVSSQEEPIEEYTGDLKNYPMKFWRADPSIFNITDSKIFPIASIGDGGSFSNLGVAWIAWTIEVEGKLLAAHAIFERGKVKDFTMEILFHDVVYWYGVQSRLFLITSDSDKTTVQLFQYQDTTITQTLDYNSTNHQILITPQSFTIFLYQNGTRKSNVVLDNFQLVTQPTNTIMLSTMPDAALYQLLDGSLLFYHQGVNELIPSNFSKNSILGHIFLNYTVFDIDNNQAWVDGKVIPLPEMVDVYQWGIRSSILRDELNTLYEFNGVQWEELITFPTDFEIYDFSIIDIGLYIGAIAKDGLQLLNYGFDDDNDFIPDTMESYFSTFNHLIDTDGDTIPDVVEISYGTNPLLDDRLFDYDQDGLTSIHELNIGLDPLLSDTDFGGAIDGWELKYDFNPLSPEDDRLDNDNDGAFNYDESKWGSSPYLADSDGDTIPDGWEIRYNLDPMNASNAFDDNDNDHRNNLYEYEHQQDPLIPQELRIFSGIELWILLFIVLGIPITRKLEKILFQF